MTLPTVEQFQNQFRTENPQYFNPTSDPTQMAANRAKLVADSGGTLKEFNGQVVSAGIVGSNDPTLSKQTNTAVINAGNAITGPVQPQNTRPPDGSYYEGGKLVKPGDSGYVAPTGGKTNYGDVTAAALKGNADAVLSAKNQADRTMAATQLQYSADLASTNLKYGSLFNDLKSKYDNSLQVAQQNAISLNPYSNSRGATVAENFKGKITENYNSAARQLQAQADVAQQQLAAGNYKAYIEIQNGLDKVVSDVTQKNNALMLDFTKQVEQSRQFETSLKSQETRAFADDFRLGLTQLNFTPQAVDEMVSNGSIYQDPTFLSGVKAHGIEAIPGIISAMKSGSLAQQKQVDLQKYREETLRLSEARLTTAQNNLTRFQSIQAAQQSALTSAQGSGYEPDDPRYAFAAAQGSALGSPPTQADRDYYANVQSLVSNAGTFRTELDKLSNNSQLRNMFSAWVKNPFDDEAQTFMATQMPATYRIASIAFGQSGRGLSDKDFEVVSRAIGTGAQSAKAREEIFAGWLQDAKVGMTSKLKSDAFGGIHVVPYAYDVENASKKIDTLISSTKNSSVSPVTKSILDKYHVTY